MGDVTELLHMGWDLMIAHPPCTHLAVSGSRWFKDKVKEQAEALVFVQTLMDAPIPRIAIENPISVISSRIRKPDQIIQPWQFGHGETKATCLWLKGLPKLTPTNVVEGREARVHRISIAIRRHQRAWFLRHGQNPVSGTHQRCYCAADDFSSRRQPRDSRAVRPSSLRCGRALRP